VEAVRLACVVGKAGMMPEFKRGETRNPLTLEYVSNPNENAVIARLLEDGATSVLRGGWPDFICFQADGTVMVVEVKGPTDSMRPEQRQVIRFLHDHRVLVRVAKVDERHQIQLVNWVEQEAQDRAASAVRTAALAGRPRCNVQWQGLRRQKLVDRQCSSPAEPGSDICAYHTAHPLGCSCERHRHRYANAGVLNG
jgi:VRR-NUC domain